VTGGHRTVVGTPQQVADDLLSWVDEGACDGFSFNIDRYIDGLEHLVDWQAQDLFGVLLATTGGRPRTPYVLSSAFEVSA
jgi:hypothetical protein